MRWWTVTMGAVIFACGMTAGTWVPAPVVEAFTSSPPVVDPTGVAIECGPAARQLRTTLYFGLTRPSGAVSELEWQLFVRDEVTTRFPRGLTVWDADGQWRTPTGNVDHERSKVLLLMHADTAEARRSVEELIERYRQKFDQQSVLWESSRACVTS